jgi:arginyl-tRNA synthetase
VFYVQYAHARARSVLRNVAEAWPDFDLAPAALVAAETALLTDEGELRLIKRLAQWPRQVESAASAHEPHRVAFFLHDLASEFHAHWNRGNDLPYLRFIIGDDPRLTMARAALVSGLAAVLASGLTLLGVGAPAEMR